MTRDGTRNSSNQSSLNLPEGTVHGPLSFRGEKVNLRCRNSLMILGTLHHHGSMKGFKKYLKDENILKRTGRRWKWRPWITSREGGVTSHEEADQQSENDQFCLHPEIPTLIKVKLSSMY